MSGHFTSDQVEAAQQISGNVEFNLNYQTKNSSVVYPSEARNENVMGTDSLLQSNLEWKASSELEEITGMDVECGHCQITSCPPNLNVVTNAVDNESFSSDENSPAKGSPAREFLQRLVCKGINFSSLSLICYRPQKYSYPPSTTLH